MYKFMRQALLSACKTKESLLTENEWLIEVISLPNSFEDAITLIHDKCSGNKVEYRRRYRMFVKLVRESVQPELYKHICLKGDTPYIIFPFAKEVKIRSGGIRIPTLLLDQCISESPWFTSDDHIFIYTSSIRANEDVVLGKYREPSWIDWISGFVSEFNLYPRRVMVVKYLRECLNLEDGYLELPPGVLKCIIELSSSNKPSINKRLISVAREELRTLHKSGLVTSARLTNITDAVDELVEKQLIPASISELVRN